MQLVQSSREGLNISRTASTWTPRSFFGRAVGTGTPSQRMSSYWNKPERQSFSCPVGAWGQ
eukprot:7596426-Prorocentrum_lima.AAC.1